MDDFAYKNQTFGKKKGVGAGGMIVSL